MPFVPQKQPVFNYRHKETDPDAALHTEPFLRDFPEISRFSWCSGSIGTLSAKTVPSDPTQPPAMTTPTDSQLPVVDTSLRFVRVLERRADGLVSFEFSIGWPELAVELMLPAPAFEAFCANNRVQRLDT